MFRQCPAVEIDVWMGRILTCDFCHRFDDKGAVQYADLLFANALLEALKGMGR